MPSVGGGGGGGAESEGMCESDRVAAAYAALLELQERIVVSIAAAAAPQPLEDVD